MPITSGRRFERRGRECWGGGIPGTAASVGVVGARFLLENGHFGSGRRGWIRYPCCAKCSWGLCIVMKMISMIRKFIWNMPLI